MFLSLKPVSPNSFNIFEKDLKKQHTQCSVRVFGRLSPSLKKQTKTDKMIKNSELMFSFPWLSFLKLFSVVVISEQV